MATISPYKTSSGTRYRVRYRRPDGHQTDKRGFTTKRDARDFAARVEVSISDGKFIQDSHGRVTITELAEKWLPALSTVKPSWRRRQESIWGHHVQPRWGDRAISTIRTSEIEAWILGLEISPSSMRHVLGVLAAILDVAVRDRMVNSNPARGIRLPRKTKAGRVYLTAKQIEAFADATPRPELIRVLAYTGLRFGEAAALRPMDVDLENRRIHVRRNAVEVAGRIIIGSPKTHEERKVMFPKFLVSDLERLSRAVGRDELLWSRESGAALGPPGRYAWWKNAVAACKRVDPDFPDVIPHALRHTAASLMIRSGAHVKAVQRQLGHASATMTLDTYGHLFDDDLDVVASALEATVAEECGQNVGRASA